MPKDLIIDIIFISILIIVPIVYFVAHSLNKKSSNAQNRQAFAGYILATYKSLNCYNPNFEKEHLPGHLHILKNWKRGSQYFRFPEDEKMFNNFIEFTERNELPINAGSDWRKPHNYEKCCYIFLLNALIGVYCFSDYDAPCNKSDEELFLKLLDLCSFNEFKEDIQTICLKSTREKIREKIWNEVREAM